ncbi:MAG: hypothetical protein ALECFALPRED_007279 [Alectoria fallacina]|uniref:Glutaredoxin domain-containing protein n=1 Tax=Alectoria fallacina TaxID=1903189 RepID=A0A8H3G6N5_9LECA|nr:MAG: hypothetical protein ALECFALPRED_007279 [Alectoria fallacina]
MPSTRRVKVLAIALAIAICTILYLSNDYSSQDFYNRTVAALDKKQVSDQEVAQKLQDIKDAAKAQEPVVPTNPQEPIAASTEDRKPIEVKVPAYAEEQDSEDPTVGRSDDDAKSVAGRKTMLKGGETKDLHSGKEAPMVGDREKEKYPAGKKVEKEEKEESKEDHEVEMELNSILKKGPIIVFSKSYCPFSAKAKRILLEKYTIVPAPYVVELDTHPLGPGLQAALAKSTGKRTVPNVLVNGRSIGGGDDIEALDSEGNLIHKIKGMAGKRIMEAKLTEER